MVIDWLNGVSIFGIKHYAASDLFEDIIPLSNFYSLTLTLLYFHNKLSLHYFFAITEAK